MTMRQTARHEALHCASGNARFGRVVPLRGRWDLRAGKPARIKPGSGRRRRDTSGAARHAVEWSKRSIGIVTFNTEHQRLIKDLLDAARREDCTPEPFYSHDMLPDQINLARTSAIGVTQPKQFHCVCGAWEPKRSRQSRNDDAIGEVGLIVQCRADAIEHVVGSRPRLHIGMWPWRPQALIVGRDNGKALRQPCIEKLDLEQIACAYGRGTYVSEAGRAVRPGDQWPTIGRWIALRLIVGGGYYSRRLVVYAIGGAIQQTELPSSTAQSQSRLQMVLYATSCREFLGWYPAKCKMMEPDRRPASDQVVGLEPPCLCQRAERQAIALPAIASCFSQFEGNDARFLVTMSIRRAGPVG